MKKYILITIPLIIFLGGYLFPVYGQNESNQAVAAKDAAGFTIARLVVGAGIENREPTGVAEIFSASTEKVYCFLEASNIAKDSEVSFVWIYDQKEILKTNMPLKAGPKWRTNANKNLRGLKGDWKVEIRDAAGTFLKDVIFKVE